MSLVYIPLSQYHTYLPEILKLLFPPTKITKAANQTSDTEFHASKTSAWADSYTFLNVAITPNEVSIVCPPPLAKQLFATQLASRENQIGNKVASASISNIDYIVISVEGGGAEAGSRILELTGPLALAGM